MKKEYYDKKISESPQLPDLFKELQDIRYGRAKPKVKEEPKVNTTIKFNRIYVVNHKFNAVGAVIGILFIITFFSIVHSNTIFATTEKERVPIAEFETNNSKLDMISIVSKNVNEFTKKEIITEEINIDFETEYIENKQLPLGEEKITQEGIYGKNRVTKIRTYENNKLIDETVISTTLEALPTKKIIEKGTSEYLKNVQAHVGDTLYTKEEIALYHAPIESDEQKVCMVYKFIDVTLLSEENGWANIVVDGINGYVKSDMITSENVTPGIKEKSRIQRLYIGVNINMPLSTPSGLTREDFKKILSNNPSDTNKIFEENAEFFYELEEKYNINAIFVAAIGIHESNWGRSTISLQKKNLFGYGAYDSDAYGSSFTFESYQYGIDLVSKVLVKYYLNERGTPIYDGETAVGTYYNGPTLKGVNTRYASDPEWANKIYTTMKNLYGRLFD